jgi:hypothetical protein
MARPGAFVRRLVRPREVVQKPQRPLVGRLLPNAFPLLPLEEERRLNDMPLRENFIERVFAHYRWAEMLDKEPTPGGLAKFHTAHKLTREEVLCLLRAMAHSPS